MEVLNTYVPLLPGPEFVLLDGVRSSRGGRAARLPARIRNAVSLSPPPPSFFAFVKERQAYPVPFMFSYFWKQDRSS